MITHLVRFLGLAITLCLFAAEPLTPVAGGSPPNIVLVLADDLGMVDIAAYAERFAGTPRAEAYYETPRLDELVDRGIAFSQAYAHQLCSPTRATLLTGKNGARLGFTTATPGSSQTFYSQDRTPPAGYRPLDVILHADPIAEPQALINATALTGLPSGDALDRRQGEDSAGEPDEVTIAELLTGYESAFLGKWHVGGHGAAGHQPSDQGFTPLAYFDAGGSPYFGWRGLWNRSELDHPKMPQPRLLWGDAGAATGEGYLTDDLTKQATDFLRRDHAKPFLLYFCHFAVHTPLQAKAGYETHFRDKPPRGRHQNPVYAGMVKSLDDSVGAILDTLEATGQAENTVIALMSDNGGVDWPVDQAGVIPTNNRPFKGGKATLYEGGVRVPLVVCLPNGPRGVWCDAAVFPTDVFPTIAEIAGQDVPHPIDGQSFAALLDDPDNAAGRYQPSPYYWHYPFNVIVDHPADGLPLTPHSAVRDGDEKLIFDWHGKLELYNVRRDPYEQRDLAAEKPDRTLELFRQLSDWIDENVADRYLPRRNKEYDASADARGYPFRDLRAELLGHAPLE